MSFTPEEEEQGKLARKILTEKGKLSCEPQHTPTPISVLKPRKSNEKYYLLDSSGNYICQFTTAYGAEWAELIVRAVNSHEALLEALIESTEMLSMISEVICKGVPAPGSMRIIENSRAAIAEAKGKGHE